MTSIVRTSVWCTSTRDVVPIATDISCGLGFWQPNTDQVQRLCPFARCQLGHSEVKRDARPVLRQPRSVHIQAYPPPSILRESDV